MYTESFEYAFDGTIAEVLASIITINVISSKATLLVSGIVNSLQVKIIKQNLFIRVIGILYDIGSA